LQALDGAVALLESEVFRATAAAKSIAAALGMTASDAAVLHNSNKLALRLLPCDVLARVAVKGQEVAGFEVELAQRLAETESPIAALAPQAAARPYEHDGFVVTLWTYHPTLAGKDVTPADYANALERLHAGMRTLDLAAPHYTDRVAEAQQLVADRALTPSLTDPDRALLDDALRRLSRTIAGFGAAEQLLHGEPHPGNLLNTAKGPLFIDLETVCRGPVAFDLAHAPEAVAAHYPGVDADLVAACRALILAMVAAWRWDANDAFPNGARSAQELMRALREGPPWPSLDVIAQRMAAPEA
jgi:hypothetical protein